MRVVLIDNYDSYTQNVAHLLGAVTGTLPWVVQNDRITIEALRAFQPQAIVLSPGPGHPATPRDIGVCRDVLDTFYDVPILGLCLGHQLIALHFGGTIGRVHEPKHGTTAAIRHDGSALFTGVPQDFLAMKYHSLTVDVLAAPLCATAWAGSELMALRHVARPIFGVQFHPESIASEHGERLLRNFLGASVSPRPASPRRHSRTSNAVVVAVATSLPPTPLALFEALAGDDPGFLLQDPAERDYSFIGTGPIATPDTWDALRALLPHAREVPELPFATGLVGAIPYETRGMRFFVTDECLAVDHARQRVLALARAETHGAAQHKAHALAARIRTAPLKPETHGTTAGAFATHETDYAQAIARCLELIRAGEAYELCLTHAFSGDTTLDPWTLYKRLVARNPSPYAGFFRFADATLLLGSPERLLRVSTDGIAETRPIKGTRPRGADAADDAAIAERLRTSEKDRRENLMIVDVARHDLGSVAMLGGVTVPDLLRVEPHPTVFQLVSTVRAELREGKTAIDAAEAVFPPASMTGAPKLRAMEWLRTLEQRERGFYAGAAGYFSVSGSADLAVVIRSMTLRGSRVSFGVGGAILLGSDPAEEWRETQVKAKALLDALGVSHA